MRRCVSESDIVFHRCSHTTHIRQMRLHLFLLCLLTGLSAVNAAEAERCFDAWIFTDHPVAISIKPSFKKHASTIGQQRERDVQWIFELLNRADSVQMQPIRDYWGRQVQVDCVAEKKFYNGTAKMSIRIDKVNLKMEQCPFVTWQARSESPTRCRIFRTSASDVPLNFIVFNRTAQMQAQLGARQTSFCLDRLSPATTYLLCLASHECQNDWNCEAFTTLQATSQDMPPYAMDVYAEWTDSKWVQLSWPPPKIRRPASPPIGYVISVRRDENCWEREVLLSAPWATEMERAHIRKSAERLEWAHRCGGRTARVVDGQLDGYWPDFAGSRLQTWVEGWNGADVDEQGPLGIFAVTVGDLQANTFYKFAITPIFHPHSNILSRSTDIQIKTASYDSRVSVEAGGGSMWISYPRAYDLTISEIGAYPIHCNHSSPTFNNGAAEILCRKSFHSTRQKVKISLIPGAVYRLKMDSSYSEPLLQKVVRIPPERPKFQPQIKAIALSSNLVFINVIHLNATVSNPLAFITRICQTTDTRQCKLHPLHYEVVSSYSLYQNRSVWRLSNFGDSAHFNARIQTTNRANLQVSLYAYPGDPHTGEEVQLATTTSEPRKDACKSWCVWPVSDWSNTNGGAVGAYNREFARRTSDGDVCEGYCEPLSEAIDGESGCTPLHKRMQLCNLPVCSAVAPIGCVTDADSAQGTSWISVEWKNPRESVGSFPKFLILVTSHYDAEVGQVFVENTDTTLLPPFLQSAVQSLHRPQVHLITDGVDRVNITNLAQNMDYNIAVIPYLLDGRIGAVLEKTAKTKMAAPCRIAYVKIRRNGSHVSVTWQLQLERTCSVPTDLVVEINETRRDVKLEHPFDRAHLTHNFEFCRTYHFRLRFDSFGGRREYPHALSSEIGYPDIADTAPFTYLSNTAPYFGVSFTPKHSSCVYEYALQWGIWPNFQHCKVIAASPTGSNLPTLKEGFVYNFKARVQPPGLTPNCNNETFASAWSEPLTIATALSKSEVKTHNVTVTAYIVEREEKEESSSACPLPQAEYSEHHELREVDNSISRSGDNASVCIIVDWTVDATSAGSILGYILQLTQSAANNCRLIWVPCEDCFPGYGLRNASPEVAQQLRRIASQCIEDSTQLLQNAEQVNSKLYKTTMRLVLGFESLGEANDTLTGTVRVHAVKMGSIHQIMVQFWQTNAQVILSKGRFRAGLITGILAIVLITILIAIVIIRKRRAKIIRQDQYMKVANEDEDALEADSMNIVQKKFGSRLRKAPPPIHLSHFVNTVANYATNDYAILREEFKTLQCNAAIQQDEKGLTMEVGAHPENQLRNRYKNVLPFDHNRLKLTKKYALADLCTMDESDPKATPLALNALSDYVNASLIPSTPPLLSINCATAKPECRSCPNVYVAAQAPKRCSVALFWQAIWDSNVRVIVMLTRLHEREKEKCWPYWPRKHDNRDGDGEGDGLNSELCSATYGNFAVTLQSTETGFCYIRRVLVIHNKAVENTIPRRVIQLLMTSWDDFKVPRKDDFYIFLKKYWDDLKAMNRQSVGSVLVHCSAGVGRTGTFIAIDMLARYIEGLVELGKRRVSSKTKAGDNSVTWQESIYANLTESGKAILLHNRATLDKSTSTVDIFQTVLWIRSQRLKSVQQDIQYIFIHDFLSYYIQSLTGEVEFPIDSV
ncbi:protein tyrosine phosphatase receptor type [Echinococcus multilocularis]|uniref:Receptor type tyrosine protein phosphatase n=1 Tax=Echinococcus multilocularis TaxID=6211 RepID=A0A087W0H9_ECHMU|nr:protein tyrosine phosphatase receptor type [Echinococcus multilocularis]